MGTKKALASLLGLFIATGVYIAALLALLFIVANGYFASWFWRVSHDFGIQHRIEDREYGLFGFGVSVIKATSPVWLSLLSIPILVLALCAYLVFKQRLLNSNNEIRISKGWAICGAVVLVTAFLIPASGYVVVNSLLLARLSKWLPHFTARGEPPNFKACIACMVLLSLELILAIILLLVVIVFLAISICILVFLVCFRKTGWTWKDFNDIFKHRFKIDIEECFWKLIKWYKKKKQGWNNASVRREENETDLQGA